MNPFAWAVTTIAFVGLWVGTYVLYRLLGLFGRPPSGLELAPFYGFVVSVASPVSFRLFLERKLLSATWLIAFTPLLGLISKFAAPFAEHNIPALQTRSEATQAAVVMLVVFLPFLAVDLSQLFAEQARCRAAELGVADRVRFIHGDAAGFVADAPVDVAACVGATWIGGGVAGTLELLARVRAPGRPGATVKARELQNPGFTTEARRHREKQDRVEFWGQAPTAVQVVRALGRGSG